jgi:hypothetical protein
MDRNTNKDVYRRKLFVDFMLYTDNDLEFKLELIDHMIDNLAELSQAYITCVNQNDHGEFHKACHKVKTTLVMLEDDELRGLVDELKKETLTTERVIKLKAISEDIIASLVYEKSNPSLS